jgi:hypothetical protein
MILVRYTVNYLTRTVFRELNFDKQHEKNFKSMYDDVIEELSRSSEISIEQCIIVIAHNLVFSIRNNFPYNITQNDETKNALVRLKQKEEIFKINMELVVDNFSKRIFHIDMKNLENLD